MAEVLEQTNLEKKLPQKKYIYFLAAIISVFLSLFHLITAYYGILPGMKQRIVHIGCALALYFLFSVDREFKEGRKFKGSVFLTLLAFMVASLIYLYINEPGLPSRAGIVFPIDTFFGVIFIITILAACWHAIGAALPLVCIFILIYTYFGPYMPGLLTHRGFTVSRIIGVLFLSTDGIFGIALGVSATFIALFIMFGALLDYSGAGNFFTDLAQTMFGRVRGGPAKVAIVSSSLFGTFTGSALANVTGTGTFTIPLMKKVGFSPEFAGAVEAVASSGGQFMPPIMASVAFIIAEVIGIPYIQVALHALIPALIFYFALFMAVHLRASRLDLKGTTEGSIFKNTLIVLKKGGHLLLPIIVLLYLLAIVRVTPMKAGFWSIITLLLVANVRPESRFTLKKLLEALIDAGRKIPMVAIPCAAIGIIIGSLMLTGLGFRLSSLLITIAGGNLLLLLIFVMITSILLGMGVPTLAAYLLLSIIIAPSLIEMGVTPIAAHFFFFYFGIISNITPPVAVAAYTAAGIAGGNPFKTGLIAVRLGIPAYFVPFIFVYEPALLFIGSYGEIGLAAFTALIGSAAIAAASEGWFMTYLHWFMRVLVFCAAISLIIPGATGDIVGGSLLLFVYIFQRQRKRRLQQVLIDTGSPGQF